MNVMFTPLPDPKSRWKEFLTSWGAQSFALLFIINLNLIFPAKFVLPERYMITNLVPYEVPVPHEPQPVNPHLLPKRIAPPAEEPVVTRLEAPPLPQPKRREQEITAPVLRNMVQKLPNLPSGRQTPKVIATNTFSTGSSLMPTTNRPPSQVQTGGFGDPNGVPARPTNGRPVNINAFGSWDLPSGPGYGNGTGGAKGIPGVVASAGFGNGLAIGTPKGGGGGGVVRQAGFSDGKPVAEAPQKKTAIQEPPTTPAEIISKPRPAYTAEGRALKIEGEVRLEVLFTATGQVHVIRVLQGLGHGLDEQAMRAAEQIKFKPAQRQCQAVDSNATLHIIFQLA